MQVVYQDYMDGCTVEEKNMVVNLENQKVLVLKQVNNVQKHLQINSVIGGITYNSCEISTCFNATSDSLTSTLWEQHFKPCHSNMKYCRLKECEDLPYTKDFQCKYFNIKCITNGTDCVLRKKCQDVKNSTDCVMDDQFNEYEELVQLRCVLKTCYTAPEFTTEQECNLYKEGYTTKLFGACKCLLYSQILIKYQCVKGVDGQCVWYELECTLFISCSSMLSSLETIYQIFKIFLSYNCLGVIFQSLLLQHSMILFQAQISVYFPSLSAPTNQVLTSPNFSRTLFNYSAENVDANYIRAQDAPILFNYVKAAKTSQSDWIELNFQKMTTTASKMFSVSFLNVLKLSASSALYPLIQISYSFKFLFHSQLYLKQTFSLTTENNYLKEKQFRQLRRRLDNGKCHIIRGKKVTEIIIKDLFIVNGLMIQGNAVKMDKSPMTGESEKIKK